MEQLVAEGIQRTNPVPDGDNLDLSKFPNCDFYYKLVAKTQGKYYSIYDGQTEYKIGSQMSQKAMSGHRGGYYVYATVKEAIFADVPFKEGGHYIAPRTVIKCICWGAFVQYSNGKIAFSHLLPVADLGLPLGYKSSKAAVQTAIDSRRAIQFARLEQKWDLGLAKRNNTSLELYENNTFENYFGHDALKRLEKALTSEN